MSKHAIIGANIMDRLVKCPGSLKCGNGSLKDFDKHRSKKGHKHHYANTVIENTASTKIGLKIDEMAKNLLKFKFGLPEKKYYTNDMDYLDSFLVNPAQDYCNHMVKIRSRFGRLYLDPYYDMTKYMKNIENVEFRVVFNPDFVAASADFKGMAFVSDLSTGTSHDRNKMFQVICCAVGLIDKYKDITSCICEVYNTTTKEVMLKKLSREELEAYRDDIIIPTLENVRQALSSPKNEIEQHRHNNSWCAKYCIFAKEGCCACNSNDTKIENNVFSLVDDIFFKYDNMLDSDRAKYKALFE